MSKFAIIETGGKQYKVSAGDKVMVEKLDVEAGSVFSFDKVLLTAEGENVTIGEPYVEGASVEGRVVRQARDKKKIVFKYHSKTRQHKKKGHRQPFTEVLIEKV
ncbi:MAG: 50S ribosomal protein L21 [Candidatus Liptonbacteria bacterium]|nr:50S ribosomal protein L21 [Candidatus Liptonbacteria bacterium]